MKEFWTMTRVCFSAIGGWLGYFLGGCDNLMIALIVFVVADYVTGVMCAIIDKKLSSEVGFKGIFKKVLIFYSCRYCAYSRCVRHRRWQYFENSCYLFLPVK